MMSPYLAKNQQQTTPAQVSYEPLMKFKLLMGCSEIVITSFPFDVVTAFEYQLKVIVTQKKDPNVPEGHTTPSHPWP